MRHHVKRLGAAGAALLVGLVLATGGASTAFADDPVVTVTFDAPTTATIPYGSYWQFNLTGDGASVALAPWSISATCSGCPSGYAVGAYNYEKDPNTQAGGVASNGSPLPPGTYSFTATLTGAVGPTTRTTDTPAQLTITKASLGVAAHVAADGLNPRNAIVSAGLTGDLINQSEGEGGTDLAQVAPAGTWKISITDADGAVVQDFTADRAAGGYNTAVSFSWPDVAAGTYTAKATFTASGASASNFTISPSAPAAFTAPGAAAGDSSTAAPAPSEETVASTSGPSVPVFVLIATGLVALALLALVVVQIVQLSRLRPASAARESVTQ